MAFGIKAGANLNLVPTASKQTLASSYLDFTADGNGWAQQYLPDLMEKEAEVFGNRTVSGFLAQVGAEEAMASDQVVWSEQGRLHLAYICTHTATDGTFTTVSDIDGRGGTDSAIRKGDMIVVSDADQTVKGYVTDTYNEQASTGSLTAGQFTAEAYVGSSFGVATTGSACRVFVFGSEYKKGTTGRESVNAPSFQSYSNQPIILKDKYEVSGSDASAVGWVEVSGEEGQNGYLWYLKASGDTKARFTDYCEMALIEAEKKGSTTDIADANIKGTEALYAAVSDRGNIASQIATIGDFDDILREFDKQGSIEENMMFLDRDQALLIDDMLAAQNGGNAGAGSAYGVFDNDADMALNLGFSGFRRGSYDFYKTDWKYLNDVATRGSINDVAAAGSTRLGDVYGCIVPAGVSTVYDQNLGKNLKRPFLHVRYRASQTENRKYKTWTTGSVGAVTSDLDAMEMHFLSERCLVVQGANNFMLIKGKS